MTDWDDIRRKAAAFRGAIESFDRAGLHDGWPHFPLGCCHGASRLLLFYLRQRKYPAFTLVVGARTGVPRHVWLRCDHYDLDITADQFDGEGCAPVVLEHQSRWHARLDVTPLDDPADFQLAHARGTSPVVAMYEAAAAAADAAV